VLESVINSISECANSNFCLIVIKLQQNFPTSQWT